MNNQPKVFWWIKNLRKFQNMVVLIEEVEIKIKKQHIEECIYKLNRKLPYYKRIGKIHFVNSFKKTYTGKIIRRIHDERACEKNTC